jgi:hypothetical protein
MSGSKSSFDESPRKLVLGTETLVSLAQTHAPTPSDSILAEAHKPITLEDLEYRAFSRVLQRLCTLANGMGYAWVGGINSNRVGGDYIFLPRGQTMGHPNGDYTITGPAYIGNPNRSANPDPGSGGGYWSDSRTSFEFFDVKVVQDGATAKDVIFQADPQPATIHSFEVDNIQGQTPVTGTINLTAFTQGEVGASATEEWSSAWHMDVSATETFSAGGGMFPSASLSLTESAGYSKTDGGSRMTSNSVTNGSTDEYSFSYETPAGYRGKYTITASQGTATLPFSSSARLTFGVKIYNFLRYDDGKAHYYPSGDSRPFICAVFGGGDKHFTEDLDAWTREKAAPWDWERMFAEHPETKWAVDSLVQSAAHDTGFPAAGVLATITRSDVTFKTISVDPS